MKFRQKFLGYSGGLMTVFGVTMVLLGQDTAYLASPSTATTSRVNGAAGVPMWTGLLIIMCGLANIVEAFEKQKKPGRSYYELPFSVTVFFANFVALSVSAVCIGLLSWSLYGRYLEGNVVENTMHQAVVGLYATIIIAACLVFIFALMALFIDCCVSGFIGFGMPFMPPMERPQRDRESPYDTYAGRVPAIYK